MGDKPYYAHSVEGEPFSKWELLEWHLRRTGALARRFARAFGAGNWGASAGLLHDVGKYSEKFQDYIKGQGQSVDHSTGGAIEAIAEYKDVLGHLLAYGIAGHHAGLPDGGQETEASLASRLRKNIQPGYKSWRGRVKVPARGDLLHDLTLLLGKCPAKELNFATAFFIRMLFSCLVDADFLATEWFLNRNKGLSRRGGLRAGDLAPVLRAALDKRFATAESTVVNRARADILAACRTTAAMPCGVFSLSVPTGGGKTLSSLSFALEHAAAHGLDRVIYAIPYTSITEQTADEFRKALRDAGSDIVVEHHSAAERPDRSGAAESDEPIGPAKMALATENWDAPVMVTTTVQLFESLYAHRPSRCRKLHNLARAVIVLDEVQALPIGRVTPCLAALRELVQRYGSTVVLCSATIPNFADNRDLRVTLPRAHPIVEPTEELRAAFLRVKSERWVEKIEDAELIEKLGQIPQALCIVDSRRHAIDLFDLLPDDGARFHLSAGMCPAHRRAVLETVKARLADGLDCRLIATRVIEAGVDISFPEVWRAMAGIDSLIQAAGRANREGKLPMGRVVIFEPARPDAIPKPLADLRRRATDARNILEFHPDPLAPETVKVFFDRMFMRHDSSDPFDEGECYRLLERLNEKDSNDRIPFRTVSDQFRMIDDAADPVIVRLNDEAEELIDQLSKLLASKEVHQREDRIKILRKLQNFTINCYSLDSLRRAGDIIPLDSTERFFAMVEGSTVYRKSDVGLDLDRIGMRDADSNIM